VPGWQDKSIFASWHHERSNRDTSDRIKRTLNNRFDHGGALTRRIFGYVETPGATSDEDLAKDPAAEPVYKEWFRRLDEDDASFESISDWLISEGVPPGPYCRSGKWTGRLVGQVTRNPILKGERFRNERESVRVNSSGKRVARKAPPEKRRTRIVTSLAFFSAEYWDRVIEKIQRRNAKYNRKEPNGQTSRERGPRKRVRYPGQVLYCGVCGYMFVFGGHGQTDRLMCDGARHYHCWNGVTANGPFTTEKIGQAIFAEIEALKGYDAEFLAAAEEHAQRANAARTARLAELSRASEKVEREIANVLKMIREGCGSALVKEELTRLEAERGRLQYDKSCEEALVVGKLQLPPIEELKQMARAKFQHLPTDSFEFAAELRRLAPRIVVFPYQLLDGGGIVLRAKVRLQLAELIPDKPTAEVLKPTMEKVLMVDLFDPPQREKFRLRVVAARRAGQSERSIAKQLGITVTAAQRAMALQRLMDEHGLDDPYVPVDEPPEDGRMCRHKHPRYKFAPRPDAGVV
jgi:hypothetical protein